MQMLLIFAIFWPAVAGLAIYFVKAAQDRALLSLRQPRDKRLHAPVGRQLLADQPLLAPALVREHLFDFLSRRAFLEAYGMNPLEYRKKMRGDYKA